LAGTADISSNLIDSLLSIVDTLRGELHPAFGARQFNVSTVIRTWGEGNIGEGPYTDVETLLDPQPRVMPYQTDFRLEPCGLDEAGLIQLSEISLTYSEAELTGSFGTDAALAHSQEFFYKIEDAYGQRISTTYWVLKSRPFPDRESTIGWVMELRKAGVTQ
jgi:hypothetical protein